MSAIASRVATAFPGQAPVDLKQSLPYGCGQNQFMVRHKGDGDVASEYDLGEFLHKIPLPSLPLLPSLPNQPLMTTPLPYPPIPPLAQEGTGGVSKEWGTQGRQTLIFARSLVSAPCLHLSCLVSTLPSLPTQLSIEQLRTYAQAITVKVLSKEFLGSGILINRQGQVYTVVTNAHVLRAGNPPYQIQTPDQRLYLAVEMSPVKSLQGNDLAVLQFRSSEVYTQATVGDSSTLKVGDQVFAAGFPFSSVASSSHPLQSLLAKGRQSQFAFTTGQVSLMLDKALEGGYKIGYTNDIRKGMSGGPVLNSRGEVVGINGRHADPLWDAPDSYQDGSRLDKSLQEVINRFSWAVPMETVMHPSVPWAMLKNFPSQPQSVPTPFPVPEYLFGNGEGVRGKADRKFPPSCP